MFKKPYRLPANVRLRQASTFRTPLFTVKIAENQLLHNRFGFIVKKTIDKRATTRNRLKRVFRSCIEEMNEQTRDGFDMLFLLEKGIIEKKRETMYDNIKMLLAEKKLLK